MASKQFERLIHSRDIFEDAMKETRKDSKYSAPRPRIEPCTSWLQVRTVTALSSLFGSPEKFASFLFIYMRQIELLAYVNRRQGKIV
jgi:hypothetical protein